MGLRSPLVHKAPSAMFRMTLDLELVNNTTNVDDRPMPNIETILLDVKRAQFFAQMDIKHAYIQVIIHTEDRHKHSFRGTDSPTLY